MFTLKQKICTTIGVIVALVFAFVFNSYAFAGQETDDAVQKSEAVTQNTENTSGTSAVQIEFTDSMLAQAESLGFDEIESCQRATHLTVDEQEFCLRYKASEHGQRAVCPDVLIPDPEARLQWHLENNVPLVCLEHRGH